MDFCCSTTMSARLAPLYADGGALLTDVPFLYCRTCGQTKVAPTIALDVMMYTDYCDVDGIKQASLYDVVDRSLVGKILKEYPEPDKHYLEKITDEQIDHLLDVWNFASQVGDEDWIASVKTTLYQVHKIVAERQLLQEQS